MSVVISGTIPTALFSKSRCNPCLDVSSSTLIQSGATAFTVSYAFAPTLITAGMSFIITDGFGTNITYTFVAATPTNPTQIEIDADILTFGANVVEAFQKTLFGYSYIVSDFGGFAAQVDVTANNTGTQYNLVSDFTMAPGAGEIAKTDAVNATINRSCVIKYEAFLGDCRVHKGTISSMPFKANDCDSISALSKVDLTFILEGTKQIFTSLTGESVGGWPGYARFYPDRVKDLVLRFQECCTGVTTDTAYLDSLITIIGASCSCKTNDVEDFLPKTIGSGQTTKFLNTFGDHDASIICKGTPYPLCIYAPGDNEEMNFEVTVAPPGGGGGDVSATPATHATKGVICNDIVAMVETAFPAITNNTQVTLYYGGTAGAGTSFISESVTFIYKINCCNDYISYLNCYGSYQTMYVGKEINHSVQVETKNYLSCENCEDSYTREFTRLSSTTRTFYTRPLMPTVSNLRLLRDFFNSTSHFLNGDTSDEYELIPGEYSFRDGQGRMQIPFTIKSRTKDKAYVNNI